MNSLETIQQTIHSLPISHQLAFGIGCVQRFIPFYDTFSTTTTPILIDTLELLKKVSTSQYQCNDEIEKAKQTLENLLPDMDDYAGDLKASLALDVCSMIGECLDFVQDKDAEHITTVSYIAVQSIEFIVADKNQIEPSMPDFDAIIENSTEMKNELELQYKLLETLIQ